MSMAYLKIRLPDQINAGTALRAYKEVIVQYETICELGPDEISRIDFQNFLLDVETVVARTLTMQKELKLFYVRHALIGDQRSYYEAIKVKLGRAFDRYELHPVDMYFSENTLPNPLTPGFILRTVATHYGLPSTTLLEGVRKKDLEARRVAMYLSRLLTAYTLRQIGAAFGRDEYSVRRAIRFVDTSRHSRVPEIVRQITAVLKKKSYPCLRKAKNEPN